MRIKWINPLKCLEPCLACSLCSINVSGYSLCSLQPPWCWFGSTANASYTKFLRYLETGKQLPLSEKSHPHQHIRARSHNMSNHMVEPGNQEKSLGCHELSFIISILHTLHTGCLCLPLQFSPSLPSILKGLHILSFPVEVQKSGTLVSIYNTQNWLFRVLEAF